MARERDPRVEALKRELKPLMKRANQRLVRLEQQGLASSPSYRALQGVTSRDRPRFTIGHKGVETLQDDKRRMLNFLGQQTSTVKGTKQDLKRMATSMRVPFADNPEELTRRAGRFFGLSHYVKDYIRNSSQGRNLSSDEIFMGISRAVESGNINLESIDFDNFDLTAEQMETIVREARGEDRYSNLYDELEGSTDPGDVQYKGNTLLRGFDPEDF